MWKKLNNARVARQPTIPESPTSYDTVYDGRVNWPGPPGTRTITPPIQTQPLPARRPQDEGTRALSTSPLQSVSPPTAEAKNSEFRSASSIYSEPSPNKTIQNYTQDPYSIPESTYQDDDVSPPSSPEFGADRSQREPNDDEVSPIDSMPDVSKLGFGRKPTNRSSSGSKLLGSSIPVLRREKKRNQVAAAAQNLVARKQVGEGTKGRTSTDPRWDPYSGEITTSDNGKPQSVKPGQFSPPQLRSVQGPAALGNQTSVTAAQKNNSSFGDRVRRLNPKNNPTERPEWKGATGRVTLVSPVRDQFHIPPMNIPRKSSKRVASPVSPLAPVSSGGETAQQSANDPTVTTIILNSGENSPQVFLSPTATNLDPDIPAPLETPTNKSSQIRGNLPTEVENNQGISRNVSTIERNFREAFKGLSSNNENEDSYDQPPSRFSVTTYAPSEKSSARPSIDTSDHPLPTPPSEFTPQKQASPILHRKRPQVLASAKATTRKAVNTPSSPVFISMTSSIATKRVSNIAKTLPQTPAEAESLDLISSLNAQLENLAHRRRQIEKSIRQMTEMMPTDNITLTADVRRKRESEKEKIEKLREEEADVRRLEHELGLKLHRAYKRRDKDADYELTGLWVRRVTG